MTNQTNKLVYVLMCCIENEDDEQMFVFDTIDEAEQFQQYVTKNYESSGYFRIYPAPLGIEAAELDLEFRK